MIAFSEGSIHDIDHLIRVWTYARTIGELEGLDSETQLLLETAAIVHDIACPLCREKYGYTNGKYQELEGAPMAEAFLADSGLTEAQVRRIAWLVGHHHTFRDVDGPDHQILLEADYIANATEKPSPPKNLAFFRERFMKTRSGREILDAIFSPASTYRKETEP